LGRFYRSLDSKKQSEILTRMEVSMKKCMIIVLLNNGIQFILKVVQIGVGWKKNDE
jgi:hypothetical protein